MRGRFRDPEVYNESGGASHKFQTPIEAPIGPGTGNENEVVSLQLQLIEALELVERKDKGQRKLSEQLAEAHKRINEYLLVQDQLYMEFAQQKNTHKEREKEKERARMRQKSAKAIRRHIQEASSMPVESSDKAGRIITMIEKTSVIVYLFSFVAFNIYYWVDIIYTLNRQ